MKFPFSFVGSLLLIFTLISCNEKVQTTVSVSDSFTNVGNGEMVATLSGDNDLFRLKGKLELYDGVFEFYLMNPIGDTIYTKTYTAVTTPKIDTTFQNPYIGRWKFTYRIVKLEDVLPNGSFDFSLIY